MASLFECLLKKTKLSARLKIIAGVGLRLTILCAFLKLIAATSASGQQLVQNGNFESGDFSLWTQSGNTASTTVDINSSYAHSGTYGAKLGPSGSLGFISQILSTTPGQTCYLSLWLDSPNGSSPNEFQVSWNGTVIFDQTNMAAIGWTNLQFAVAPTGTNTVLQFGFRDDPSYLGLDDISLTNAASVPVPAAYTFTTLAGYSGVGSADGLGSVAQFNQPFDVAVDTNGNVFVVDSWNNTIRKLTPGGVVSTIAGFAGVSGNVDGAGRVARFNGPTGIALDSAGNLYVSDNGNATIRKIALVGTNWVVSTIAGDGFTGPSIDGTNSAAGFGSPWGVAVDGSGNVYVSDNEWNTIRKIFPAGTNWVTTTIAGLAGYNGSAADGTNSNARFNKPQGLAVDHAGNLYVADSFNETIRKIFPAGTNWVTTTIAGLAGNAGSINGTNSSARFNDSLSVAVDISGNLYVADAGNDLIRKITPAGTNWMVSTLAGQIPQLNQLNAYVEGSVDGTGTNAQFGFGGTIAIEGLTVDTAGNVYVADTVNNEIRKVTSAGVVTTLAGLAGGGGGSVNGNGSAAQFNNPQGVTVDNAGNVYVADYANDTIRKITSLGVVSTIAGLATNYGSADGAGSNARFYEPSGITVDSAGNLYVADTFNYTIRKITPADLVTTIAGLAGVSGSANGTNSTARFHFGYPAGIDVDTAGNIYVADYGNYAVRKITPVGTNWVVSTIAGGTYGIADGRGTNAQFSEPAGIAVDGAGNIYVADNGNQTIRRITPVGTNWVVSTIAGTAYTSGNTNGIGTNAFFNEPAGIAADNAGNLYVADTHNNSIRKLSPFGASWSVSTIGGGSIGSTDGAGSAARFRYPNGIAVDNLGTVYVADTANNTIRKGVFTAYSPANAAVNVAGGNGTLSVTLLPAAAGGQWRFGWEQNWRAGGTTVSNLVPGNYPVQFRSVPGWLVVQTTTNFTVAVPGGVTTYLTNQYYPTLATFDTNSGGTLTVNLATSPAQPPPGAGWHFLGDTSYYPSGLGTNLVAGTYQVGFAPVSGYSTPPNLAVTVNAGLSTILTESYLLADAAPSGVNFPFPVPSSEITDVADYPFGFNGQLQSDVGYGSGVAVSAKVVLSAAHLVFNDETLNYVGQAYWYFQQETNVAAVQMPQVARGWLVLSGYASQRTNDLEGLGGQTYGPDQSSPQSRNLDVAALYFTQPAAGGGYGGYLPSDATPNPWLTGNSLKMVAGYPVDGSLFGNAGIMPGVMYQTTPQPYAFNADSEPEVYTASWVLGYPGDSGGPVYVQLNGYYYPAGVYLGTINNGSYETAVRAIDSSVVNLITNAEALADSGTNYSGGGVITIIPSQAVSASNPGYLEFLLGPPAAVAAGAGWELQGDSSFSSATNYIRAVLSTNAFTVVFKPVTGWNVPASQSVSVTPGNIAVYSASYTAAAPLQIVSPQAAGGNFSLSFQSVSGQGYTLYYNTSLSTTNWLPYTNVTGNGSTIQLSVPISNPTQTFFRVSMP